MVGRTGLNALSAAEDSVVTVPEKLQIQSLIKSASCSGSIPGGGGRACLGTDPWGSCCTPWSCRAVSLKLHSTLESADISQCPGQINYIRICENGTQDSGFLKLPSYTHWEAKIENPWSRGYSSLGHRAGGESACFLRAALTSWSVGGTPWIRPLTWAFSTWKDGPASGTTRVPVSTFPAHPHSSWRVIFLSINANCVTPLPSPCRTTTGHGGTSGRSPCFSF